MNQTNFVIVLEGIEEDRLEFVKDQMRDFLNALDKKCVVQNWDFATSNLQAKDIL